jgi:hypothetical protein
VRAKNASVDRHVRRFLHRASTNTKRPYLEFGFYVQLICLGSRNYYDCRLGDVLQDHSRFIEADPPEQQLPIRLPKLLDLSIHGSVRG